MNGAPASAARYLPLIEATLRAALSNSVVRDPTADGDFQLERVLPTVAKRLGFGDASESSLAETAAAFATSERVVDRAGHSRPAYAALAVRAMARALGGTTALERFTADNAPFVRAFAAGALPLTATNGQTVVAAVFAALAIEGGSDGFAGIARFADADPTKGPLEEEHIIRGLAIAGFGHLIHEQQPDGTFLARTDADAPEPRWYDELAILHALHCWAVDSGSDPCMAAVERAVRYHAAETQPDHASNHPWAIAAFLREPDAVPLADMMLHSAGVQSPQTMDAVALLLLVDALDCGRRDGTR